MTPLKGDKKLESKDLLLLGDHENDYDDIVPELTEAVKIPAPKTERVPMHKDFLGDEFNEVYDDWILRITKLSGNPVISIDLIKNI